MKPKAFAILLYLVRNAGRLVTQEELLKAVWPDTFVQPEVLKRHVFEIREALADDPKTPLFVETLPRRGYQFIATVRDTNSVPPAADTPAQARLVGREQPLADLRAHFQRMLGARRQIVLITGEPGIGKTALVDEFQRLAGTDPHIRIARGQCVEGYGGKEPYYAVLEALGDLCRGPDADPVLQILAAQAPTWLVQFPAFVKRQQREMLQREVQGATRQRMLREIADALETITAQTPLLLLLEDLHWADPSTVDLLSSLARGRSDAKLMLIGTYRPAELMLSNHPLKIVKQDLLVHQLCHELALEPLGEVEISAYLAGESPDANALKNFASLLHKRSEGNPLFMIAELRDLTERGFVSQENGGWRPRVPLDEIDLVVPEGLRQMIEVQIERLSAKEQQVLEVASVESVGRSRFTVVPKVTAIELEPEAFEDVCEILWRRHYMLRPAGSEIFPDGRVFPCYEFVHELYREVCYRRISPRCRAQLHRQIGQWAEAHLEPLNELGAWLAGHFEQGGDWQRAIKYLHLAADTAGSRFEAVQATEILEHARKLADKLPESERVASETGILERVAGICAALGEVGRACQTYATLNERAGQYHLIHVQVRALAEWAFIESWESSERGLELLERAFQLVAKLDPVKHMPVYATCLFFRLWLFGWNSQHAEEYQKVIGEIRELGSPQIVAPNLLDSACIQWCSSEYGQSHRSHADGEKMLLDISKVHPSLSGIRWTLWQQHHPINLLFLGEWGAASRSIAEAIAMAHRNGDFFFRARSLQMSRAWLHFQACDFAGVLAICEAAVPLARDPKLRAAGSPPPFPFPFRQSLILRGLAEAALGEYDLAREYLSAVGDEMDHQKTAADWYWRMPLESGLTELWLGEKNLVQARPQAERFLAVALTTAERTWQALAWETNARVALAELDAPRARDCIAKALATMEGFELPLARWRVHASASEVYLHEGERASAQRHRELSRATILKLADSLGPEEPLRRTFLSAPIIVKILDEGEASDMGAKEAHKQNLEL